MEVGAAKRGNTRRRRKGRGVEQTVAKRILPRPSSNVLPWFTVERCAFIHSLHLKKAITHDHGPHARCTKSLTRPSDNVTAADDPTFLKHTQSCEDIRPGADPTRPPGEDNDLAPYHQPPLRYSTLPDPDTTPHHSPQTSHHNTTYRSVSSKPRSWFSP